MLCRKQGKWRKITVDDLLPVDADGKLLLPVSSLDNELWPAIVCKAVCRVASATFAGTISLMSAEFGDVALHQLLTGWAPEALRLDVL